MPTPNNGTPKAGTDDITWITIPGGTFMMGSTEGDSDEVPVHKVTVPTFLMSKTEVTVAQYRACVDAGVCKKPHWDDGTCYVWSDETSSWKQGVPPESFRDDSLPVVCVDWDQARTFARWQNGRLPAEAEWEYAARSGGRDIPYPWGNEAVTCDRAIMDSGGNGCGKNRTWSVCSKPKGNTAQGVCDMAGNVWEWVEDCYHNSYDKAPSDGTAWTSACEPYDGSAEKPDSPLRVLRGGSWNYWAGSVRSANRLWDGSGNRSVNVGFRLVRPAPRFSP